MGNFCKRQKRQCLTSLEVKDGEGVDILINVESMAAGVESVDLDRKYI